MSAASTRLCAVCSSVELQRSCFEKPPFEPEDRYNSIALTGRLGQLRSTQNSCPLCRLVLYALNKPKDLELSEEGDEIEWEMIWKQNNMEYNPDPDKDGVEDLYGSALYPQLRNSNYSFNYCIQLVDNSSTSAFLRGRLISEFIDSKLIEGWLQRCREEHGENCRQTHIEINPHLALSKKFMVIDVAQACLVDVGSTEIYAALSYVWGQNNNVRTTKLLVSEFRKPGAFKLIQLPQTLREAIDFTNAINIPYLWVDCLCIVQDDNSDEGTGIQDMDTVYGNAALTIIAASGTNAGSGLQGWRSCPPERPLVVETIEGDLRLGVLPFIDEEMMHSPHAHRGWTYQEGCLSTRCLVFLEGKVYFCCRAALWREDVMAETNNVIPFEGANTLAKLSSLLSLQRYSEHVGEYTLRELTYQSDALNAFAGISNAIATSMRNTRMFQGMPAVVFDWAILWRGRSNDLKRRSGFSSWSWVGWRGGVVIAGGHLSNVDEHKWLLQRTWIDWSIVDADLQVIPIWDPERDGSIVSPPLVVPGTNDSHGEGGGHDVQLVVREKDDPGDNDSDDEQESCDDSCPTYGNPSSSNLYGRQINPRLAASFPTPVTNANHPAGSNFNTGTLVIHTIAAKFTMDTRSTAFQYQDRFFRLRDAVGRVCGLIWEDFEHIDSREHDAQIREIIVLSQASPSTTAAIADGRDSRIGFHNVYQFCHTGEQALQLSQKGVEVDGEWMPDWHSWEFFNVMLLRPSEHDAGEYEREGIGLLHEKALAWAVDSQPSWQRCYIA